MVVGRIAVMEITAGGLDSPQAVMILAKGVNLRFRAFRIPKILTTRSASNRMRSLPRTQRTNSRKGYLVVEVGAFLEALGLRGSGEVALDDVEEEVVVGGGAARVLHQQRPRVPQAGAHRRAQRAHLLLLLPAGGGPEERREIHDGEVHGACGCAARGGRGELKSL